MSQLFWKQLGSEVQIDEACFKDGEVMRIVKHQVHGHFAYLEEHVSKKRRLFKIRGTNLLWGQPPKAQESNHTKATGAPPVHVLLKSDNERPKEDRKQIAKLIEQRDELRRSLHCLQMSDLPWRIADFDAEWSPAATTALKVAGFLNQENKIKETPRQQRDRETDRLARLLRRAAELDVSRCCNDIRTLLYAKTQCAEASLCTGMPPSVSGEIQKSEMKLNIIEQQKQQISQDLLLSCAGQVHFDPRVLRIAHFMHAVLETSLTLPQILSCFQDTNFEYFHTLGLALMEQVVPSVRRFFNISSLPLNKHTWPCLARYALAIHACRELGWNDADTLAFVRGESWTNLPQVDSADHILVNLLRARALYHAPDHYDDPKKNAPYKIKVPKPSIVLAPKKKNYPNIREKKYGNVYTTTGASVPVMFRNRIFSKKPNSEPKLDPKQTEICLNLITQLLNNPCYFRIRTHHQLFPGPSLEHIYAALQASSYDSVFEFISDVRAFLKSKATHAELASDAIELLTKFETVVRAALNGKSRILAENQPYPLICASCEDLLFDEKEAHTNPISGLSFCISCIAFKSGPYILDGLVSTDVTVSKFGSVPHLLGTIQRADYNMKKNEANCILRTPHHKVACVEQWPIDGNQGWKVTTDEPCLLNNIDVQPKCCWSCSECLNSLEALDLGDQWLFLLSSLIEVALTTDEVRHILSQIPDARTGLQIPPQTQTKRQSFLHFSPNGSTQTEERKKHKESLLISQVIHSSCDYLTLNDNAKKNRLITAAHKGGLVRANENDCTTGACVLCGGNYDYLNSSMIHMPNGKVQHDFCTEVNAAAGRGSQQTLDITSLTKHRPPIPSPYLGMGRTEVLGVDDRGHTYWKLPAAPSWLFIQLSSGAYLTCKTVAAQTRIYKYLQSIGGLAALLCPKLKLAFPAIITNESKEEEQMSSMTQLAHHFSSNSLAPSSVTNTPEQEDILIRSDHLLWWGRRRYDSFGQSKINLAYAPTERPKNAEILVPDESCLKPRQEAIIAQKLLYKKYTKKSDALSYLQDNLIASHFLSAPHRYFRLTRCQLEAMTGQTSESLELRAALILIEAALPSGAKYNWSAQKGMQRVSLIRRAWEPTQLLECIIMLEDELRPGWLADHWLDTRTHLPSRTHVLRFPSFSLAALFIFTLDSCLDYDKTEFDTPTSDDEDIDLHLAGPNLTELFLQGAPTEMGAAAALDYPIPAPAPATGNDIPYESAAIAPNSPRSD